MNGLVHINRIKPYFYRDELSDDLEDVLEGNEAGLEEAKVPEKAGQGSPVAPKAVKSKKMKNHKAGLKPGANRAPIIVPTQGEQAGIVKPAEIDEDTEIPDPDTMYEAQCILKQRLRKGGKRQFLVKWADMSSTDYFCDEIDVFDVLLAHWFITHIQKGLKRKRLNLALINVPSTWARRPRWEKKNRQG